MMDNAEIPVKMNMGDGYFNKRSVNYFLFHNFFGKNGYTKTSHNCLLDGGRIVINTGDARGYIMFSHNLFKKIADSDKKQVGDKSIRDLMEDAFKKGKVSAPQTGRILEIK